MSGDSSELSRGMFDSIEDPTFEATSTSVVCSSLALGMTGIGEPERSGSV